MTLTVASHCCHAEPHFACPFQQLAMMCSLPAALHAAIAYKIGSPLAWSATQADPAGEGHIVYGSQSGCASSYPRHRSLTRGLH